MTRLPVVFGTLVPLLALSSAPAFAAWISDGNPVCTAPRIQSLPAIVADGQGGAIAVWLDHRRATTTDIDDLYALRLDAAGNVAAGWLPNGNPVCVSGTASQPFAVPDGEGGALVVWLDNRASGRGIYVARVDGSGQPHAGWPIDGRFLSGDYPYTLEAVVPDGGGGAYYARRVYEPVNRRYLVQVSRVDRDGAFPAGWGAAGVAVSGGDAVRQIALAPDPAGGVLWTHLFSDEYGIGGYNGANAGRVAASGANGMFKPLPPYATTGWPGGPASSCVAPDGSGGLFAAWRDGGVDYAQHFDAAGNGLWPGGFLAPGSALALFDGGTGIYLVGQPAGTARLELHRLLADGARPEGWSAGVVLTTPSSLGTFTAQRFAGGVLATWSENTAGAGLDIRAAAVLSDARFASGFGAGGRSVCVAPGDQTEPALAMGGGPVAFMAWSDARPAATAPDVYATALGFTVPVAVPRRAAPTFGILALAPNPACARATATLALDPGAPARVALLDVTGRRVVDRTIAPGGAAEGHVELNLARVRPGLYWVRVTQGARTACARLAVAR